MNIFILAGGFGTRLSSVVSSVPKPMAPIQNKPFLDYQISHLKKYFKNNKIYLLTYYLSDIIESYYKTDEQIEIIKEKQPLGTGGSIKNAIETLSLAKDEELIVLNGDTYIEVDFNDFREQSSYEINILGSYQINCQRYGTLEIEYDRIIMFNEKLEKQINKFINAGCYYFKKLDFFDQINDKEFSLELEFQKHVKNYPLGIVKYKDIFIDIGIPEDYKKMQDYIKSEGNGY